MYRRKQLITSHSFPALGPGKAASAKPTPSLTFDKLNWDLESRPPSTESSDSQSDDDDFVPIRNAAAEVNPDLFKPRLRTYSPQSHTSVELSPRSDLSNELSDQEACDAFDEQQRQMKQALPKLPPRPRTGNYLNPKVRRYLAVQRMHNPAVTYINQDSTVASRLVSADVLPDSEI